MSFSKTIITVLLSCCILSIYSEHIPSSLNFLEKGPKREEIMKWAVDFPLQSALVRTLYSLKYDDKILIIDSLDLKIKGVLPPTITRDEGVLELKEKYAKWTVNMNFELEDITIEIENKGSKVFRSRFWFKVCICLTFRSQFNL
jgi:hypothetical protein